MSSSYAIELHRCTQWTEREVAVIKSVLTLRATQTRKLDVLEGLLPYRTRSGIRRKLYRIESVELRTKLVKEAIEDVTPLIAEAP